jgi:hypothetical protein
MEGRPHWADILMAVFTGLILLTYLTSDYFLWKQLGMTQTALADSENSFKQTLSQMQAQTAAQQGSMKAMQDALTLQSELTDEANKAFRTAAQANRANRQMNLEQAVMAKKAGNAFNQIAVNTTASASRELPLFVASIVIPPKPDAGEELSVSVVAHNYGLSPAIDAKMATKCFVKDEALDVFYGRKQFNTLPPPTEGGMIVERLVGSFFKTVSCRTVSADEIKQISIGKFPITIAGDIYYMDQSGQPEHAEFCAATLTGGLTVSACLQHNNPKANTQGQK